MKKQEHGHISHTHPDWNPNNWVCICGFKTKTYFEFGNHLIEIGECKMDKEKIDALQEFKFMRQFIEYEYERERENSLMSKVFLLALLECEDKIRELEN